MKEIYVDANPNEICFINGSFIYHIKSDGTNNQNEYKAILSVIAYLTVKQDKDEYIIYSDSQLVVNQLNHLWSIDDKELRKLAESIWNMVYRNNLNVKFVWISRKDNKAGKLLG